MSRTKPAASGKKRPTRLAVQTETTHAPAPAPKLPHERDESTDEQRTAPDEAVVQGYVDVERGLIDTDRRQDAARTFEAARRKKPKRR
jgi:hypothetical protein